MFLSKWIALCTESDFFLGQKFRDIDFFYFCDGLLGFHNIDDLFRNWENWTIDRTLQESISVLQSLVVMCI